MYHVIDWAYKLKAQKNGHKFCLDFYETNVSLATGKEAE